MTARRPSDVDHDLVELAALARRLREAYPALYPAGFETRRGDGGSRRLGRSDPTAAAVLDRDDVRADLDRAARGIATAVTAARGAMAALADVVGRVDAGAAPSEPPGPRLVSVTELRTARATRERRRRSG